MAAVIPLMLWSIIAVQPTAAEAGVEATRQPSSGAPSATECLASPGASAECATILNKATLDAWKAGKLDEARQLGVAGIAAALLLPGNNSAEVAEARNDYGLALDSSELRHEAVEQYLLAEALWQTLPSRQAELSITLRNLGWAYSELGDGPAAIASFTKAIAAADKSADYDGQVKSYRSLALTLMDGGRNAEADAPLRRALAICLAKLGEANELTKLIYSDIGSNLDEQSRYDEARPFYLKSYEIRARVDGPSSLSAANMLSALGGVEVSQGNDEKAIGYYERSLAIRRERLGDAHPSTARAEFSLGQLKFYAGDVEAGLAQMEAATAKAAKALGADHKSLASNYRMLAVDLNHAGRFEEADAASRRGLQIMAKYAAPTDASLIAMQAEAALTWEERGRTSDALAMIRQSTGGLLARLASASHDAAAANEWARKGSYFKIHVRIAWKAAQ